MSEIPPTLPFHLAKVYGTKPAPRPAQPTQPFPKINTSNKSATEIKPAAIRPTAQPTDTQQLSKPTERIAKLIAAKVNTPALADDPVQPRPANATPQQDKPAFQLYSRPADRNIAATRIQEQLNLGSSLDTSG